MISHSFRMVQCKSSRANVSKILQGTGQGSWCTCKRICEQRYVLQEKRQSGADSGILHVSQK